MQRSCGRPAGAPDQWRVTRGRGEAAAARGGEWRRTVGGTLGGRDDGRAARGGSSGGLGARLPVLSLQEQQQLPSFLQQLQQHLLPSFLQQPLVLQPTSVSTPAPRTRRSAGPPASKRLKSPVRSTSALSPQNLDEVNLFWRLLPDFTSGAGQTNFKDMALEWNNQLSAMLQHGTQGTIRAKTHLNLKSFHEWFVRAQARAASERTSLLSTSQSSAASLVAAAGVPGISASGMAAASAGLRLLGLDLGDTGPSQGWALPSGPGMQSGMPAAPPATAAPARRKPARRGSLVCFAWLLLLLRCLTIPSTLALAS